MISIKRKEQVKIQRCFLRRCYLDDLSSLKNVLGLRFLVFMTSTHEMTPIYTMFCTGTRKNFYGEEEGGSSVYGH